MPDKSAGTGGSVEGYVDIYLLPVPEKNLEAYRQQATTFGTGAKEPGALSIASFAETISTTSSRSQTGSS